MRKVKFYWDYPISVDIDTEKNVEVYIDKFNTSVVPDDTIRIIILQEPFRNELFGLVQEYRDRYTYVLTYQEEILATNPKARLFLGVATWMWGYVPPQKKFCVSAVIGSKTNDELHGYSLRHRLWWSKELITVPTEIYLSSQSKWSAVTYLNNLVLGDSKAPLFDSQFHIAIENTSCKNMFTEKLVDCLQTKTVPIYYGCTNIGDYFNLNGIIVVNSVKEIVDACNSLTPDTYNQMLPAVEDNFTKSGMWCNYNEQVRLAIVKLIG
jgi:hypothetical protein